MSRLEVEVEEEERLQERNSNPYTYGTCHAFGEGWGIMGVNADDFYLWSGVIFALAVFLLLLVTLRDDCICLLYTSPSPRDVEESRMPSSA